MILECRIRSLVGVEYVDEPSHKLSDLDVIEHLPIMRLTEDYLNKHSGSKSIENYQRLEHRWLLG